MLIAPAGFGKSVTAGAVAAAFGDSALIERADGVEDFHDRLLRIFASRPHALAIVCARKPLKVPFDLVLPHEVRLARAKDLCLAHDAISNIFSAFPASAEQLEQVHALTLGWPAAVLALHARAQEVGIRAAIEALETMSDRVFERYVHDEVLQALSNDARSLAFLAALQPISPNEAELLLGDRCGATLDEVEGSFLIRESDGMYRLHPLLKTVARRHFQTHVRAAAGALAGAYDGARLHLRAAQWHALAGDSTAVSAAYSRLTFAEMAAVSTGESAAVGTLDDSVLIENLAVFNVAALEQLYTRDVERWLAMAEEALKRAPAQTPPELRMIALGMLVTRYAYFGRYDDAGRILKEQTALAGDLPECQPLLALFDAFVKSMHDEMVDLAALRQRLGALLLSPHLRGLYAALAGYLHCVQGDWTAGRSELEALIEQTAASQQEMNLTEALMGSAFLAWAYGDDAHLRRWLDRLAKARAQAGSSFFLGCVQGDESIDESCETPTVRAAAYLIASSLASDAGRARRLARRALTESRRAGRRFYCILSHCALILLDSGDAGEHLAAARVLANEIPSEELRRAVDAVANRSEDAGMLNAFRTRFLRERSGNGALGINVLTGTIEWEGKPLGLKERARRILFALALAGSPLTGDHLASLVWPDRDPGHMQNALRVHIANIRKASDPGVILHRNGRYAITNSRVIDLDAAETTLRQARHVTPLGETLRRALENLVSRAAHRDRALTEYEWFAPAERRADAVMRAAVVALAEDALQRRDTEAAIRYANHMREQDPCDERARSITIRAHIATGNKSEAVREYRDYRRAVRNELGIEIFPEAEIDETLRAFVSPIER